MPLKNRFPLRSSRAGADREMSLIEHLGELRIHLIISVIAIFVCSCVGIYFAKPLLDMLTSPLSRVPPRVVHDPYLTLSIGADGVVRLDGPVAAIDWTHLKSDHIKIKFDAALADGVTTASSVAARQAATASATEKQGAGVSPAIAHDAATSSAAALKDGEREVVIGPENDRKFFYRNLLDPFMLQFKLGLMLGIVLALPIIIHQIWLFVAPGLTLREKKVVGPMLRWGFILFPMGGVFAFFMISILMRVMQTYQVENVDPLLDIFEYLDLLTTMMLVFGFIFELPLAMAIAARIGLITPKLLTMYRRHIYVGLALAAMVLTPADAFTMVMALVPLVILFEFSVILSRPMHKAHKKSLENAAAGGDDGYDGYSD